MKIEGKNATFEILNSDYTIEKILIARDIDKEFYNKIKELIKAKNCKYQFVDKKILDINSSTKKHQGIICFANEYSYKSLDEVISRNGLILILDNLQDPHNFASIIRSCECAKINAIIIGKNRSVQVNETVIKVSTGAIMHTDIVRVTNINDTIKKLKENNYFVYALDMDGNNIYKTNLKGNIALVLGSEGFGINAVTKKNCDGVCSIPMRGRVNSLNASNAAAIAVFEYNRQNFEV